MKTVWIVTSEYNAYDQYGCYFEAVYFSKPTVEQLMERFSLTEDGATHLFNGGGRIKWEDHWYNLTEETEG